MLPPKPCIRVRPAPRAAFEALAGSLRSERRRSSPAISAPRPSAVETAAAGTLVIAAPLPSWLGRRSAAPLHFPLTGGSGALEHWSTGARALVAPVCSSLLQFVFQAGSAVSA